MLSKLIVTFGVSVLVGAVLIIYDVAYPALTALGVFVGLGWMLMRKEIRL